MPRMYLSARGEVIDFDAHMIKQQLAAAPMTIDVEKRKTFIDSKETRKRPDAVTLPPTVVEVPAQPAKTDAFEPDDEPAPKAKKK